MNAPSEVDRHLLEKADIDTGTMQQVFQLLDAIEDLPVGKKFRDSFMRTLARAIQLLLKDPKQSNLVSAEVKQAIERYDHEHPSHSCEIDPTYVKTACTSLLGKTVEQLRHLMEFAAEEPEGMVHIVQEADGESDGSSHYTYALFTDGTLCDMPKSYIPQIAHLDVGHFVFTTPSKKHDHLSSIDRRATAGEGCA
jgi:hypothetical protein